ncbi:Serine/threonine-protein kinase TOR [Carex littledalei]|uniref:Serine/threonine-protein kinase TOR n=1 Tax=Carex littledalei TaxID=544730 RepID=A0A833QT12_9POAL|nr:Serine/threonine-protein kinase TOR [Carex littledalei]
MKASGHYPDVGKKPKDLLSKDYSFDQKFNISTYISSGQDAITSALRKHVEEEARELSGEAFSRFMDQLYEQIYNLLESSDTAENLLALRAIDALIDVPYGENASKVSKFSNYLRMVFEVKREPKMLVLASSVLGHLARAGGAMTADEVERQIKNALEWLKADERVEYRRFASVLILKEMAENASTVFNVHVPEFVDAIWVALRDPVLNVRERAVEALRACLRVIEKRETRWRVQWYYRMCEAAQLGLGKNASVPSIHGSLLAVGELLRNTGEFMMSRYREVADIVLKYLDHKDRLVRLSITALLPRIAHFLRDRFVTNYLKICMDHILAVLRTRDERGSGFTALGEMAGALGGELVPYLPTITLYLREAIAPRRGRPSHEAITCVGNFAKAMGPAMEPHVRGLLDCMFAAGLSKVLVVALEQISLSIPSLLPTIQERLLDSISFVLSKAPYPPSRLSSTGSIRAGTVVNASQSSSDVNSAELVQLALHTLAHFNFKGYELLEFCRECVVVYLEDEDSTTRKDAAICCCRLVANSLSSQYTSRSSRIGSRKRRRLVEEIVQKLLIAAVADLDVGVRKSVFESLENNPTFDDFLAQADILTSIFVALNDEEYDVRVLAISVAGRLSEKNPAYVLPALRRHLIQLLTYLDQSTDSKCREESAKLLGCLIRNCGRLILPYIAPVHKALVARLRDNNAVVTGALATVGELAKVGGFVMGKYLPELMPLIVEALLDGAAIHKREVAVSTLGQVVQSTGYVITPYNEYPMLLGLLLKLLNGELAWTTRREVLKVLGIMGALDPHTNKRNQSLLPGPHEAVNRPSTEAGGQHIVSMEEMPMELWPSFAAASEDYYSTVAISSLMRILRDPSLSSYHQMVVGSLIFIFKSMGLGCVPYLPKVLPELFRAVRICEDGGLKEFITWKLGTLVSIVRQHIRKYLPELLQLISDLWTASFSLPAVSRPFQGSPVLHLVEQLCLALNDDFRTYMLEILPCCIQVLNDAERCNDYSHIPDILHTLEVFGGTLDVHMHLVFPALIRLFRVEASVDIRRHAIHTLTKLIPRVQVSGHVSSLVHHLNLVLDGNNDELRKDALDALCCLACALGEDFSIFLSSINKLILKHHIRHSEWDKIEARLKSRDPHFLLDDSCIQKYTQNVLPEVISDPLNDFDNDSYEEGDEMQRQVRSHQVNDLRLRIAGEASQRSTKEDWAEWMRHFSIELLKESPSPALRTCARLAQLQPSVWRELFAAGFASCWAQMNEASQELLVRNLKTAFSSQNIPPEILATLLNLAEFMEHDDKPLPIDTRLLGALAEKCRAYAKALHYKEMEFQAACSKKMGANPVTVVESLIHINNQLHQHEAAIGILTYSQENLDVQLKESWYEKLQRWEEALNAYTAKSSPASSTNQNLDATLGRMRCLAALARWEELNALCREQWTAAEPAARLEMAPMIFLNQEHRLMLAFAPDYDHLPLIAKVEVFEHALQNTEGNDLNKVLWLKSRTSEVWLERRTNYTRSLAVMSMVGYLLGLGDRHPSNLMLHRYSGKILHIDFGDCFEASMNREKFPEKVPFRLTRMLVNAMEVSGIEGNFRSTCENVMQVLRTNKDSVMAMMEAFVHDPLINWRLFNFNEVPQVSNIGNAYVHPIVNSEETNSQSKDHAHPTRGARERELLQAVNQLGDANEVLNVRAVAVMERMSNKLTGRDFSSGSLLSSASAGPGPILSGTENAGGNTVTGDTGRDTEHGLSVKDQVQKLILQARSSENLCQSYVGWCPFW